MIITINSCKIFAFSDTHGRHRSLKVPSDADIFVFAGDATEYGTEVELRDFLQWYADFPVKHKLFIPGNHDTMFDFEPQWAQSLMPDSVVCLAEGVITFAGIRFCVLDVRPYLHGKIDLPADIDVLVTHGPPEGILDEDGKWGCSLLRQAVFRMHSKSHFLGIYPNATDSTQPLPKPNSAMQQYGINFLTIFNNYYLLNPIDIYTLSISF